MKILRGRLLFEFKLTHILSVTTRCKNFKQKKIQVHIALGYNTKNAPTLPSMGGNSSMHTLLLTENTQKTSNTSEKDLTKISVIDM